MRGIIATIFLTTIAIQAQSAPIHDAVRDGDTAKLERLLSEGVNVNTKDALVGTPLHMAAMTGRADAAKILLEHGARANMTGGMANQTPLQIAVMTNADIVAMLLENGADSSKTDLEGNTPLHLAAGAGNLEVVKTLLDHGSDLHAPNSSGVAAVEFAGAGGYFDVVDYLVGEGAFSGVASEPVSGLLAGADPSRGSELFVSMSCSHCHAAASGEDSIAPNLWGIVGRQIATGDFNYSQALKRETGNWTYEALNAFISNPARFAPGNLMSRAPLKNEGTRGIGDIAVRADLIAFLRQQADQPEALPEL
jgi:cytochrome c